MPDRKKEFKKIDGKIYRLEDIQTQVFKKDYVERAKTLKEALDEISDRVEKLNARQTIYREELKEVLNDIKKIEELND